MLEKNENSWSPWCQSDDVKVEELRRKGFVEKMSFEPGVEERRIYG